MVPLFVIARPAAADTVPFTPQTTCAALIFYSQTDNVGVPTPEAKARLASLLEMMKPYTDALQPYGTFDALIRKIFASLDMECRKDQGQTLGVAVQTAGEATIDVINRDLKTAGRPDHVNYPAR